MIISWQCVKIIDQPDRYHDDVVMIWDNQAESLPVSQSLPSYLIIIIIVNILAHIYDRNDHPHHDDMVMIWEKQGECLPVSQSLLLSHH